MSRQNRQLRVALYARVSTSGHGQDVDLQLDELRGAAKARGWKVTAEFADEGISGTKTTRPGLDAMMEAARLGKLNVIAFYRLDRLGRSLSHVIQVLDELASLKVDIVSLKDAAFDTTTSTGQLMIHILAAFAAFEVNVIRERVTAGVRRAQAKGIHCGRPRVELDVRPALALLQQGHGLKKIAGMLGVNRSTLRERLKETGHWPRSSGVENPTLVTAM